MRPTGYYFGDVQANMIKALKEQCEAVENIHPILQNIHISIRKLPVNSIKVDKQIVIQKTLNEDIENGFLRWQEFSIKVFAPNIQDLNDLCNAIEGCLTLIEGKYGIKYINILLSASDNDNAFSVLDKNQSLLEDNKIITFEAMISPIKFES